MRVCLGLSQQQVDVEIDESKADVLVAKAQGHAPTGDWETVTANALAHPVGTQRLREYDLKEAKVVIITDDWGRPTPAYRVIPTLMEELAQTGVASENITFLTGNGMHDPMPVEDLRRKLGSDIVDTYRCVSPDAGDPASLEFCGFTSEGTPIYVNKHVYEADFKIVVGRVFLHVTYGYEGGYKMIVPGVASFETIMRNHSRNFAANSTTGNTVDNPSRSETDEIGQIVGLDFVLNYAMNHLDEPVMGYAGDCLSVHRACIQYGERHVWGACIERKGDVVIASAGAAGKARIDSRALFMAMNATRVGGTVIMVADPDCPDEPDRPGPMVDGLDLRSLSMGDLVRLHEKRTWNEGERAVQHIVKAIRGEFYRRRIWANRDCHVVFVGGDVSSEKLKDLDWSRSDDVGKALTLALSKYAERPRVIVMPEAATTLPLEHYHTF